MSSRTRFACSFLYATLLIVATLTHEAVAQARGAATSSAGAPLPTFPIFSVDTKANPFSFHCSVAGAVIDGVDGPTGNVAFLDQTTGQPLGTAPLGTSTQGLSFQSRTTYTVGSVPQYLATADFNGDEKPDLVVGNYGSKSVSILLNKGDGTFKLFKTYALSGSPTGIVIGDFNGDTRQDFAVAYSVTAQGVTTFLGNGDGTFQSKAAISSAVNPLAVVTGDFDADGKLDLAIVSGSANVIQTFSGKGDGTFAPKHALNLQSAPDLQLIAADVNGDGKLDLVSPGNVMTVFLNDGEGSFQLGSTIKYMDAPVLAADINRDGKIDLVQGGGGDFKLLLGNGDGVFQPQVSFLGESGGNKIVAADFDDDGNIDLAGFDNGITLVMGKGNVSFGSQIVFPSTAGAKDIVAADFDGDGKVDLATADTTGTVSVLLNFQASTSVAELSGVTIVPHDSATHHLQCNYLGDANYAPSAATGSVGFATTVTPVLSLPTGKYDSAQTVKITDAFTKAKIFYTTDGSTPTEASTLYTGPIVISSTVLLKAVASAPNDAISKVAEASYTISPLAAAPVFSPAAGTYAGPQQVAITDATPGAIVYYTTNGTLPTTASARYTAPIAISTTTTIQALAVASGLGNSPVASATYTITQPLAATPVFSPATGTFGAAQLVSVSSTTPGAIIHYTLDGTTPTVASTVATGPLVVLFSETIRAVAVAPNFAPSAVASASYVVGGSASVLTVPASAITASGAKLNAFVNIQGLAATCRFQYGLSTNALTSSTATVNVAATPSPTQVSLPVTGLLSKTTYYFRAVITSVGGTSTSAVVSFKTN